MRKLAMLIVLAQMQFAATAGTADAIRSNRSVTTHGQIVRFGIAPAEKASRTGRGRCFRRAASLISVRFTSVGSSNGDNSLRSAD